MSEMNHEYGDGQLSGIHERITRLVRIYDVLPSADDAQGLTLAEINRALADNGGAIAPHTLRHDIKKVAELFYVYSEKDGRRIRWKRCHDQLLGARLRTVCTLIDSFHPNENGAHTWTCVGASRPGDCPDFPSDIQIDCG